MGIVSFVGLLAVMISASGNSSDSLAISTDANPPQIEISPTSYDWGSIGTDVVEGKVNVKNTGGSDLVIYKISTSCGCTSASLSVGDEFSGYRAMDHGSLKRVDMIIHPGEEGTLSVRYDPLFHGQPAVGTIKRSIYLRSNDPENPEAVANFQAYYQP